MPPSLSLAVLTTEGQALAGWLRHSLRLLFPAAAHAMDGRAAALLRLEGAGLPRVTWDQLRCPIVGTAAYYVRAVLTETLASAARLDVS